MTTGKKPKARLLRGATILGIFGVGSPSTNGGDPGLPAYTGPYCVEEPDRGRSITGVSAFT